nr:FMN-binding protein [Mediterraneibacter faecis]
MPEEIDTVSRATCSSNAIIDGCKKALETALRPEETEAQ